MKFVFIILLVINLALGLDIWVVNSDQTSLNRMSAGIGTALQNRGHSVTLFGQEKMKGLANNLNLTFELFDPFDQKTDKLKQIKPFGKRYDNNNAGQIFEIYADFLGEHMKTRVPEMRRIFNDFTKPDLIVCDFFVAITVLQIAKEHDVQVAVLGAGVLGILNLEDRFYFPDFFKFPETLHESSTFENRWDKTVMFLVRNIREIIKAVGKMDSTRESLGLKPIGDLFEKVDDYLVIVPEFVLSYPRSTPPNIRMVGWIVPKDSNTGPNSELANFLDAQQQPVYYLAFGSQFFPPTERLELIVEALMEKLSGNKLSLVISLTNKEQYNHFKSKLSSLKNVYLSTWINQRQVLQHPNVKLFLSHGGLSSIAESILEGKPVVALPLGAEQFFNAVRLKELQIGSYFDIWNGTKSEFLDVLGQIESNYETHTQNCQVVNRLNELMGGAEMAAKLIEAYQLAPEHFMAPEVKMSPVVKYNLDIYGILLSILFFVLYLVFSVVRCICRCYCCRKKKQKTD